VHERSIQFAKAKTRKKHKSQRESDSHFSGLDEMSKSSSPRGTRRLFASIEIASPKKNGKFKRKNSNRDENIQRNETKIDSRTFA
jgi:hypothetical protein